MRIVAAVLAAVLAAAVGFAASEAEAQPVRVASKTSAEQVIVGEIYATALEAHGVKVERNLAIGGTRVAHNALASGEIDLYPEYTGAALKNVLKEPMITDPAAVYRKVKTFYEREFDLLWLKPSGINNGAALVVRRDTAAQYELVTLSDLAKVSPQLKLGAGPEFADRRDGLPGLKEKYGIEFAEVMQFDALAPRYAALTGRQIDVASGFATDWQIAAGKFVSLADDRNLFAPYYLAPVVRMETIGTYPQIEAILNKVSALLDNGAMREMKIRVETEKEQPRDVAAAFLRSKGIIK